MQTAGTSTDGLKIITEKMQTMVCQFRTGQGMLDVNGYLPTHHKKYSQPPTGRFEHDVLHSRDKRIFNNGEMEIRRAKNTTPMLLQTKMRDTCEILTDISLPIYIGSRHWGAFIMGIKPEIFIDTQGPA